MRLRLILLITLVFRAAAAFANPDLLPPLSTDLERASYLMWVDSQYPGLLDHKTSYEVDLFSLIERETKLVQALRNINQIRNANQGVEISVYSVQQGPVQAKPASDKPFQWSPNVALGITQMHQAESYKGALVGLAKLLPAEKAKQAYRMTAEEAVAFLKIELQETISKAEFDASIHHLTGTSRDEILEQISHRIATERNVLRKCADELIAHAKALHTTMGEEQLKEWLASAVAASDNPMQGLTKKQVEDFGKTIKKYLEAQNLINDVHLAMNETRSTHFTLREVPPHVGIFRGWAGGDCSSQYTFAYPWAPQERVFFVHDHENRVKGYIGTSVVQVKGGATYLYVHTIQGARISATDTDLIIAAFQKQKAALGVSGVLLPTSGQAYYLVNYAEIRGAIAKRSYQGRNTTIAYFDPKARDIAGTFKTQNVTYDNVSQNTQGFWLEDSDFQNLADPKHGQLAFEATPIAFEKATGGAIRPALLFLQESNYKLQNNEYLSQKISRFIALSQQQRTAWTSLFSNQDGRNYETFTQAVNQWFADQNLNIENYRKRLDHMFLNAYIRMPDAFRGQHSQHVFQQVVAALTDEKKFNSAESVIQKHIGDLGEKAIDRILKAAILSGDNVLDQPFIAKILAIHPRILHRWETLIENTGRLKFAEYEGALSEWLKTNGLANAIYREKLSKYLARAQLEAPDYFLGADGAKRKQSFIASLQFGGAAKISVLKKHHDKIGDNDVNEILYRGIQSTASGDDSFFNNLKLADSRINDLWKKVFFNPALSVSDYNAKIDRWLAENGFDRAALSGIESLIREGELESPDYFSGPGSDLRKAKLYRDVLNPAARAQTFQIISRHQKKLTANDIDNLLATAFQNGTVNNEIIQQFEPLQRRYAEIFGSNGKILAPATYEERLRSWMKNHGLDYNAYEGALATKVELARYMNEASRVGGIDSLVALVEKMRFRPIYNHIAAILSYVPEGAVSPLIAHAIATSIFASAAPKEVQDAALNLFLSIDVLSGKLVDEKYSKLDLKDAKKTVTQNFETLQKEIMRHMPDENTQRNFYDRILQSLFTISPSTLENVGEAIGSAKPSFARIVGKQILAPMVKFPLTAAILAVFGTMGAVISWHGHPLDENYFKMLGIMTAGTLMLNTKQQGAQALKEAYTLLPKMRADKRYIEGAIKGHCSHKLRN